MHGALSRLATLGAAVSLVAVSGTALDFATARAQVTRSDSAAVLYDVARRLFDEGRRQLAKDLLELLMDRYAGTPAARAADELHQELFRARQAAAGRTELTVWNTLFGAWLGIAVPAALGAEQPEPYGVGLLLGGPAGLLAASAYSRSSPLGTGRARAMVFGSQWGTFQGIGWRAALDLGEADRAPFTAAVVGGLGGLLAGTIVARNTEISGGDATLASHAAWWGTWYGLATAVVTNAEDDAALTVVLTGGNVGLLAGILGTRYVEPTSGQVWLTTAAGLAGMVVGLGIDLIADLFEDDQEELAMIIPSVTAGIGLAVAASRWGDNTERESPGGNAGKALLNIANGISLGLPTPTPLALPVTLPDGRRRWTPGVSIPLLEARF